MDSLPSAEHHSRLLVLVRQVGSRNSQTFNRIFERLHRQRVLQVGEPSQPRIVQVQFVAAVSAESAKFADFQLHRRVVGVIGVACQVPVSVGEVKEKSPEGKTVATRRRSSVGVPVAIDDVRIFYENLKADFSTTIVDSRCILIGYDKEECSVRFPARETVHFSAIEDSDRLEDEIREFLRNIFIVHEQKRIDTSFEKCEVVPCPLLPEEEKLRIGTENRASKAYKRKCIGRCKKQQADYTLLAGLPGAALEIYQSSIELLRAANDLLWLAGALEGFACAAMAVLFEDSQQNLLFRVSTMTPAQIHEANGSVGFSANPNYGHARHRSEEDASRFTIASVNSDRNGNTNFGRKTALSWIRSERKDKLDAATIQDHFEQAIENYAKFGFAAFIEYECMMKATGLFRLQGRNSDMEEFHRNHVGKFLDDSFTRFDHLFKAQICANSAEMYKLINFQRKFAFFARLGVLFRLHVTDGELRKVSDYRTVYPILYRTLSGYGIAESAAKEITTSETAYCGPVALQIKALHEVYTSASRAQIPDAAIRHLCHLLQEYYPHLESSMRSRLLGELASLVKNRSHNLAVHIPLEELGLTASNIVLPPVQMTRFPEMRCAEISVLAAHFAPHITRPSDAQKSFFIYSHFERQAEERRQKGKAASWVVGTHCCINVNVFNCLPQELVVRELCLLGQGVSFEAIPLRLTLPPYSSEDTSSVHGIQHKLMVVPLAAGSLTITGYSCNVFGLKNVCKLISAKPLTVDVLPELPLLSIRPSLPRAPLTFVEGDSDGAETTVYSGQTFVHSLTLVNTSKKIGIRRITVEVKQPKVSGGPPLLNVQTKLPEEAPADNSYSPLAEPTIEEEPFKLEPGESRPVEFVIFGVDPTAVIDADDNIEESSQAKRPVSPSPSVMSELSTAIGDRIPYTGRLITAQFLFTYSADMEGPEGERYSRVANLPLAITVVPAVTVAAWSVLPGDGPFTRYIVVDVTNSTEADAELVFSGKRAMSVLPKETCRVPLLCPCCTEVAGRAFYAAQQKDSKVMQRLEVERLRSTLEAHVAKHLDIRWSIPAKDLEGLVPVGVLLSSIPLLKQLVLPAISLELTVNGSPYLSQDDLSVGIGDLNTLDITVISSLDYDFSGKIDLICEQEISTRQPPISRPHNVVIVGSREMPFRAPSKMAQEDSSVQAPFLSFTLFFRVEGVYKIRARVNSSVGEQLLPDEVFASPVSFNVSTKAHH